MATTKLRICVPWGKDLAAPGITTSRGAWCARSALSPPPPPPPKFSACFQCHLRPHEYRTVQCGKAILTCKSCAVRCAVQISTTLFLLLPR